VSFLAVRWVVGAFAGVALGLASIAPAAAQTAQPAPAPTTAFTTISVSSFASRPLSDLYIAPPSGTQMLGGMPFDTGSFALLAPGQTASVTTGISGVVNVHLLVNSYNTLYYYAGQTLGTVRLTFSDGSVQETTLVVGTNVREWRVGAGSWVVRTVTSQESTQVWDGVAHLDGGEAVIDMLTVPVQPARGYLTGVSVSTTASGTLLRTVFSGLTVEHLVRPGESGETPAAWRSQAPEHSNSQNFTGVNPAKAAGRRGHRHGIYVVVSGDTLWGIARREGVSLRALIKSNPQIKNKNLILVGQPIRIP
jgi:LysM domain-containing protein